MQIKAKAKSFERQARKSEEEAAKFDREAYARFSDGKKAMAEFSVKSAIMKKKEAASFFALAGQAGNMATMMQSAIASRRWLHPRQKVL